MVSTALINPPNESFTGSIIGMYFVALLHLETIDATYH